MEQAAQCSCGQLQITVKGEPKTVVACHCTQCQKRTGSAFGVSVYFSNEQVKAITGSSKIFEQISDVGRWVKRHFCETCGTTVHWQAEFLPGLIGVAVGCFDNPENFKPTASCWEASKQSWVNLPEDWLHLNDQTPPR